MNGEMYDGVELENIAHLIKKSGLISDSHGYFTKVSGTSMTPTINDGDTIFYAEIDNVAKLKVGDIIIFKNPAGDGILAHRIMSVITVKGEYWFSTRGDKWIPDKEGRRYKDRYAVPAKDVLGVVIGVMYKTRWGSTKNEEK